MSAIVFPVGAYDFSMNEVIHQYNPHAFTRKNTPAVKWNGKTELKENSYYYTTSAVTAGEFNAGDKKDAENH